MARSRGGDALFRKGIEGDIRQKLLRRDLIEAVIGAAPKPFNGTGLAACALVLRKRKPVARKEKVLIADASPLFRCGRAQNYLEPADATEILTWYRNFGDVLDAARVDTVACRTDGSGDSRKVSGHRMLRCLRGL